MSLDYYQFDNGNNKTNNNHGNNNDKNIKRCPGKFMYTEGVLILYTNADTLTNKLNELNTLIKSLQQKPSVITITEVKLKHKWHSNINELQIAGYCMFCNNLDYVNSRGVVICYICLHSSEISIETKFSENIFVKINSDLDI